MQKFVAACCCAIVGLQVLIAVPLITCLVVLGTIGDIGSGQMADAPPAYYPSATIPPPLSPTAFGGPPGWQATGQVAVSPVAPIDAPPTLCTDAKAPPAGPERPACMPPVAPAAQPPSDPPPPLAPQVAAINEARQRLGSPIDESELLAGGEDPHSESTAALNRVAAQDNKLSISLDGAPTSSEVEPADSPAASPPIGPPVIPPACPPTASADAHVTECLAPHACPPTIVESLQVAADQLYGKAQSLEAEGNYSRADQVRELARAIRREIQTLREDSHQPPPSAVKSASYHELVPGTASDSTQRVPANPHPPLLPARAELVRPIVHPPETIKVTPAMIIVEEPEELLLLPVGKSPENPAP